MHVEHNRLQEDYHKCLEQVYISLSLDGITIAYVQGLAFHWTIY